MITESYFFITETPGGNFSLRWTWNNRCIRFQAKQNKFKSNYEINRLLRYRDNIIVAIKANKDNRYSREASYYADLPDTQPRDCRVVYPFYLPEPEPEPVEYRTISEIMKAKYGHKESEN